MTAPTKTPAAPSPGEPVKRARPGDLAALADAEPDAPDLDGAESPFVDQAPSDTELADEPLPDDALEPEPEPTEESDQGEFGVRVFGMEPFELLAALRTGTMPQQMADALYVNLPVIGEDGTTRTVRTPLSEVPGGFMRRADYQRKTAEISRMRKEAQGVIEGRKGELQSLREHGNLRKWLDKNGLGQSFFRAATELANDVARYNAMTPEGQDAYDRQQELDAREADFAERERTQSEKERADENKRYVREQQQKLEQLVPAAFTKLGIKSSKLAQSIFSKCLSIRLAEVPKGEWQGVTQAIVWETAKDTLDELQLLGRADEPAEPASRAQGGPPVTALPSVRVPGAPTPKAGQRMRIDQFGPAMSRLNGNGRR